MRRIDQAVDRFRPQQHAGIEHILAEISGRVEYRENEQNSDSPRGDAERTGISHRAERKRDPEEQQEQEIERKEQRHHDQRRLRWVAGNRLLEGRFAIAPLAAEAKVLEAEAGLYPCHRGEQHGCHHEGCERRISHRPLPSPFHAPSTCARSRVAVSDMVGVSASGSTLRCRIAGRPDFWAASKAGEKSAVFSTVAPWPPKARA